MGSGAAVESPCAGATAGMARVARRTTNGLPMKGILQNGCELAGEAGHDVFAIERLLEGHDLIYGVGAVDPDQAALGIGDPNEAGTGGSPVRHLAEPVAGPVAGREELAAQLPRQ